MLHEFESTTVIDERVAGDACLGMIGFGKTAVNDHELSARLDGILALRGMDGYVTVDDMAVVALYPKGVEDAVTYFLVVTELEVGSFFLSVRK